MNVYYFIAIMLCLSGCDVKDNNLYLFALQQILMSHVEFMFINLSLAKWKVYKKAFS